MFCSRLGSSFFFFIPYPVSNIDTVKFGCYLEASLSGVEPLMQKIHNEIRRVDAGILAAVRQQVILLFNFSLVENKIFHLLLCLFVLIFHLIDLEYTTFTLCSFSHWVHNLA